MEAFLYMLNRRLNVTKCIQRNHMPLILQDFATSRACNFYKCSLVFKRTIGHLVIHGIVSVDNRAVDGAMFFNKMYSAAKLRPKNLPSK